MKTKGKASQPCIHPTRLRRRVSGAKFANSGYTEIVVKLQTTAGG